MLNGVLSVKEDADLGALQEREKAIRQLESDIVDVNTIFKVPNLPFGSLRFGIRFNHLYPYQTEEKEYLQM